MKELKLTNQEVIDKDRALEEAGSIGGAGQFAMSIALDRFALKPFIEAMDALQEPSEKFKEYQKKIQAVNEEFGDAKIIGNRQMFVIPDDVLEEYNAKVDPLKKKYKKAIDAREEQMRQFNEETLKAPANGGQPIKMHTVKQADIPDQLTGNTIFTLMDLIELPDAESDDEADAEDPKKK